MTTFAGGLHLIRRTAARFITPFESGPWPMQSIRRFWLSTILYGYLIAAALTVNGGAAALELIRVSRADQDLPIGKRYFVEFHARRALMPFGHVYIRYGSLNALRTVAMAQVVGFSPNSEKVWDALLFTPGSVGPQKQDFTRYSNAIFRRYLTATEYRKLDDKVRQLRSIPFAYHMLFFNCNDFAGELAESIGLRRPPSVMLPMAYVLALEALNGR